MYSSPVETYMLYNQMIGDQYWTRVVFFVVFCSQMYTMILRDMPHHFNVQVFACNFGILYNCDPKLYDVRYFSILLYYVRLCITSEFLINQTLYYIHTL